MNQPAVIRCPKCERKLAERRPDGSLEVQHQVGKSRALIVVRDGEIVCTRCDVAAYAGGRNAIEFRALEPEGGRA